MFNVYELVNQHGERIYIGFTANPKRRLSQHKNAAKKSKTTLYVQIRMHKWTIKMNVLKVFSKKSSAKMFEAFMILADMIENDNTYLQNKQIEKIRLYDYEYKANE